MAWPPAGRGWLPMVIRIKTKNQTLKKDDKNVINIDGFEVP